MGKKSTNSQGSTAGGCLMILFGFFIIILALAIYSYAWVPAIVYLIYLLVSKKPDQNKKKKKIISIVVIVTSLLVCAGFNAESELEQIHITLSDTEFDIHDTAELTVSPYPSDAKINNLSISDNDIAILSYKDSIATISFKKTGTTEICLIANDSISSETIEITVVDEEAEEQNRLEEEARKKAEEEARKKVEEEAAKKAEEERLAAEQAAAEQEAAEQEAAEQEAAEQTERETEETQEEMVWISNNGSKYHSNPDCSNMKNPSKIPISQVGKRQPCKKCY